MSNSNEFNSVKDIFEDTLKYYNYNETTINKLLTDSFINGLLELQKQEPKDNNAISLLRNFSQNQSLASLTELDNELRKELSSEGYISNMLRYINTAWMNVNFEENTTYAKSSIQKEDVDNTKIGISIMASLLNILSKTAGTGQKIIASEIIVPLEAAQRLHKTTQNQYDFIEAGEQSMRNAQSGIHNNFTTAESTTSPLVVDLDGDGVETTTEENGVYFDHDNNGFAEKTAWVGKDDGLLVRDINNNGQIDDGTELFGNNSVLSNGQKAANGFEALKDLDSNEDGIFNNSDTAWNQIKVWKDANSNGIVDEGELLTLEQANISSINLAYQNQSNEDINGNAHKQTATYTKTDGSTSTITDVWFDTDLSNTIDLSDITIPEAIAALPNVSGFGNVHDLHTAMALDTSGALKTLVEQYIAQTDINQRKQILLNIIYHWTGVQDMPIDGRDPTQIYGKVIDDTRKLEALEEFMGEEYLGTWCWGDRDPNPHGPAAPYILRAFEILFNYVNNELLSQTHYKPLLEKIQLTWNETNQNWDIDVSEAADQLKTLYNANSTNGIAVFREFEKMLKSYSFENMQSIYIAFRAEGSSSGNELEILMSKFGYTYGTDMDDELIGDNGADDITALAGNDSVYGGAGNDTLNGGTGNDNIFGEDGNDTLIGGQGDDYLIGGNGADTYIFNPGFGNDAIDNRQDEETPNSDVIQFGEGIIANNVSLNRQGYDLILTVSYPADEEGNTPPNDTIRVYSYFDKQGTASTTISAIKFADETTWDYEYVITHYNSVPDVFGGLTLEGGNNSETLAGSNANDFLIGNGGDDSLYGNGGNDILIGGQGNDTLDGGLGDDTYIYHLGDGLDIINESGNHDKISFGENISWEDLSFRVINYSTLKIIIKGDENQGIIINNFNSNDYCKIEDIIFYDGKIVHLGDIPLTYNQTNDDELVYLSNNGDTVYANGGNDTVYGGMGNDTIIGGKGWDTLEGRTGQNTYVWNLGDGFDTINCDYNSEDTIRFGNGISLNDLTFRMDYQSLVILVNNDETQGMKINNFGSLHYLKFANGQIINLSETGLTLHQTDDTEYPINGTAYNDTIYGYGGDDQIYAGEGNNTIIGGKGCDTLSAGSGDDTYVWNLGDGLDTINDTAGTNILQFGENITANNITIERHDYHWRIYVNGDRTQGVKFDNNAIQIIKFADNTTLNLNTSGLNIFNSDGNDNISGSSYDDTINGGAGNDTINSAEGNDTLTGGKGNDNLIGGSGDDIYIWNLGDGMDTIHDDQGYDKIKFGEGISLSDLSFAQGLNGSMEIYVKGDRSQGIKIDSQYVNGSNAKIETLEFSDGSTFDLLNSEIQFVEYKSETITNNDTSLTLITGSEGEDQIINNTNTDTIINGGGGNDNLSSGAGNDTYIYNLGDGFDCISDTGGNNRIKFGEGISRTDLSFHLSYAGELTIFVNPDKTQGVKLSSYSDTALRYLEFFDGSIIDLNQYQIAVQLNGQDDDLELNNTKVNMINLGNGDDRIYNRVGNNITIIGGKGNDIITGGRNNDTFVWNLGDGMDSISDEGGSNQIVFGEGISKNDLTFRMERGGLRIIVKGDENQGIMLNSFSFYYPSVEKIVFNNGDILNFSQNTIPLTQTNNNDNISTANTDNIIFANGGNDTINTGTGNDIIIGGTGFDTINGGDGNDTYIYNLGDGFDTITENGGNDKIIFGEGITQNNLSFEKKDNDLIIKLNNNSEEGIKIKNQFYGGSNVIENIELSDGSNIDISNADQLIQAMNSFNTSNSASMDTLCNTTPNISEMYSIAINYETKQQVA